MGKMSEISSASDDSLLSPYDEDEYNTDTLSSASDLTAPAEGIGVAAALDIETRQEQTAEATITPEATPSESATDAAPPLDPLEDSGLVPVADTSYAIPTDPTLNPASSYYSWHLTGTNGVNVLGAWADYSGAGIKVAVLDDGFAYNLSDLSPNYRTDLDYDTLDNDNDALNGPSDSHGTWVSSFIAADNNGSGLVGIAFDSDLIGLRRGFGAQTSIDDTLEGFQHARSSGADVMNNSWGSTAAFGDSFKIDFVGTDFSAVGNEMINLVSLGRGGLGTSIVFSAGNSRTDGDNVNYKNFQNSPYVITVGATDSNGDVTYFSTPGAALLVSAPGQSVPAYNTDGTISAVSGTSFSGPIVSAIIALIYDANPNLGYRDVMEILAMSSRKTDASDPGWQDNGAGNWNGGAMHFSHDYGFGLVDATAAVRLAETWQGTQTYANMTQIDTATASPHLTIPSSGTVTTTITVAQDIEIEKVLINLDISHQKAGDLVVTLISPDGTESVLVDRIDNGSFVSQYGIVGINFQMSTNASWGEGSAGVWTLKIEDMAAGNSGTLNNWSLSFLGNAIPTDDLYVYSNEFSTASGSRLTLTDSDGGTDTINAAMVTTGMTINLTAGSTSTIAGKTLTIAAGTVIEKFYGGDGNDSVTGNSSANEIHGGRGNDTLSGGGGNDILDGGAGTDTVVYALGADNFDFTFNNATTVTVTQKNSGSEGTDTLIDIENFTFNGVSYSRATLESYVTARNAVTLPVLVSINIGGSNYNVVSSTSGTTTLTAAAMGYSGSSGNQFSVTRAGNALTIDVLDPNAPPALTLRAGDDGEIITINGTHATMSVLLLGGTSADTLSVNVGTANALYGFGGDDILNGGNGNDRLDGGDGNDTLNGGGGIDTITAGNGDDILYGGDGNDMLYGASGNDTIHGDAGADRLYGQDGDDLINGGDGDDIVYGGTGADTINGDAGNDKIYADDGNDIVHGGDGVDTIYGYADDDTLYGDAGNDILYGGLGNDTIYGGDDDDLIKGEDGNDMLYGENGSDKIYGGAGNDLLSGGAGNDYLYGEDGDDTLYAGTGDDFLRGGNGNDLLVMDTGTHTAYGDAGADTYGWTAADSGVDKIYGFSAAEGDKLNLTDILTGFTPGVSDIDDFVKIVVNSTSASTVQIDANGGGDSFTSLAIIYGTNMTGITAQALYDAGRIITDQTLA